MSDVDKSTEVTVRAPVRKVSKSVRAPNRRYVDVEKTAQPQGGFTYRYSLTTAGLNNVRKRAADGEAIGSIARSMGMAQSTLSRLIREDESVGEVFQEGRDDLTTMLTSELIERVREKNVVANIFALKALSGLVEGQPMEPKKSQTNVNVAVQIVQPMTASDFDKLAVKATVIEHDDKAE